MGEIVGTIRPPPAGEVDPLIGTLIGGKYRVLSVIASGGMGCVYKAEQEPLGRPVALKLLRRLAPGKDNVDDSSSEQDRQFRVRFLREASTLAKLSHPSIVTVYDYGRLAEGDERCFMAMEFVPGETLHRRLSSKTPLPLKLTLKVLEQIADALHTAHASGVIHRDLKPSNIILTPANDGTDRVKIIDFGIVKVLDEGDAQQELTQEGVCIGSPRYMAPEQVGNGEIDCRSDLYSLGIIAFQCLTGRVPFESATTVGVLLSHLNNPVPAMRDVCPTTPCPEWLEQLVRSCLEKNPDHRPSRAEAVLKALHNQQAAVPASALSGVHAVDGADQASKELAVLSQAGAQDPSGPSIPAIVRTGTRRRPFAMPVAAIVALAVLAIGGLAARTKLRAAAATHASAPLPAPTTAAPSIVTMTLTSTPPGADVEEDGVMVGVTPLTRQYAPAAAGQRHVYMLRKAGYDPATVVRPAGTADAVIETPLTPVADASESAQPAEVSAHPTHAVHVPRAAVAAPPPRPPAPSVFSDPDLKLRR